MLVAIYLHGMVEPLARDVKEITKICDFINEMGIERIEKVLIVDFHGDCLEADKLRSSSHMYPSEP